MTDPVYLVCLVCERRFERRWNHQLYCKRSCTIFAADQRRKGKPILRPGYRPGNAKTMETALRDLRRDVDRVRSRLSRAGMGNALAVLSAARERIVAAMEIVAREEAK